MFLHPLAQLTSSSLSPITFTVNLRQQLVLAQTCADGQYFFAVEDVLFLRHSVEFFWNRYRALNGQPPEPGSTHGRSVVGMHTLMVPPSWSFRRLSSFFLTP